MFNNCPCHQNCNRKFKKNVEECRPALIHAPVSNSKVIGTRKGSGDAKEHGWIETNLFVLFSPAKLQSQPNT